MTTERQKAANRANARRSTGPKTPKGKTAVRLNAIRHGLLARDAVLLGEDSDAFEELRNEVWAELSPVGPIEKLLVERVVNEMWRLQRATRAETALYHWRMYRLKAMRLKQKVHSYEESVSDGLPPEPGSLTKPRIQKRRRRLRRQSLSGTGTRSC